MQNIHPEKVFDYFNHIVSYEKVKKWTSTTIAGCICYVTLRIQGHSENVICHCYKCRICRILLLVLVERGTKKLLLLVKKDNYNVISDDRLYNNIILCD